MIVARRDPVGMVTVQARPHIVIPAALRHRCGPRAGDRVLLAAPPGEDTLAAYSFAVVDPGHPRARPIPARRRGTAVTPVNPAAEPGACQQAAAEAALLVLERMGLSPQTCRPFRRPGRNCRPSPSTSRSCRRR